MLMRAPASAATRDSIAKRTLTIAPVVPAEMADHALISSMITSAFVRCRSPGATVTANWIRAIPTSASATLFARHLLIS